MKKIVTIMLATLMMLGLAACTSTKVPANNSDNTPAKTDAPAKAEDAPASTEEPAAAKSFQLIGKYEEEGEGAARVNAAFKVDLNEDGTVIADRYRFVSDSYDDTYMIGTWEESEKDGVECLKISLYCVGEDGAKTNEQTVYAYEIDREYSVEISFPIIIGMQYQRNLTVAGTAEKVFTDDESFAAAYRPAPAAEEPAAEGAADEEAKWNEEDWSKKTLLCQLIGSETLYGTISISVFMNIYDDNTIHMVSGLYIPAGTTVMGTTITEDTFKGGNQYYGTYHKEDDGTLKIEVVNYDLPQAYQETVIAKPITGGYELTIKAYYNTKPLDVTISGGQKQVSIESTEEIIAYFGGGSGTYVAVPAVSTASYSRYETELTKEDGRKLYGEYLLPAGFDVNSGEKLPFVLLIHGHNSYHEVPLLNCGAAFASAGYAVYSFDFCGTNPANSKSDSSEASISAYNDRSAHSCEADMEEIIAWIDTLSYIDSEAFFVYGESRGGGLAAELTARKADRVKGAVLMYPGAIEEDLSAITIKMLAFQGTADKIGSPEGTKELAAKYPNIVLTEIDGGGHGGWTAQQYRDVQNLILDYFAECRGLDPASRAQIVTD